MNLKELCSSIQPVTEILSGDIFLQVVKNWIWQTHLVLDK